jgi:signal peptidase I
VNPRAAERSTKPDRQFHPTRNRLWKELVSWFWVILAFVLLEGTVAQARMIPSGSMENTLLVGDHVIVSLAGYEAGIPFTSYGIPLWRSTKRGEIYVFHSVVPDSPDLIKRCIGIPGDRIKMIGEKVYVNGKVLNEPYTLITSPDPPFAQFPPAENPSQDGRLTPQWAAKLPKHESNGELIVPKGEFFMMGDNRDDSYDSRYWGFVPRANIVGTPAFIYMSINAPEQVWDPGHLPERVEAYFKVFYHPGEVRWKRLFRTF